jgi:hypothetical protein
LSSMAAALRNCSMKKIDCFRVFRPKASYRRKGGVRGGPGRPHHRWVWPGPRPCSLVVIVPSGPPPAPVWSSSFLRVK